MVKHIWHGQTFWLHPNRLMYWEEQNILIGSDLHLGKTGHFRKAGIGIPQQLYKEDLQRLFAAIQHFRPKQLLVVGDLFHSEANKELDWFTRWRNDFHTIDFHLVKGNHDILKKDWYEANGLIVSGELQVGGLRFLHDPLPLALTIEDQPSTESEPIPTVSGHLHPGIYISGGSRQVLRFPCFYFTETQCILPAFSVFTGLSSVKPKRGEDVFAITPSNAGKGQQGTIIKI
ncbi:MAG: ligase-associated DNA damage response endonuclease PdeM [Bacteroidota bacterium]